MEIIMAEEFNNQLYVRADVVQLHIKEAVEAERKKFCSDLAALHDVYSLQSVGSIRARGQA